MTESKSGDASSSSTCGGLPRAVDSECLTAKYSGPYSAPRQRQLTNSDPAFPRCMQHATCSMERATRSMQHATCDVQRATSARSVQHATCAMQRAACTMGAHRQFSGCGGDRKREELEAACADEPVPLRQHRDAERSRGRREECSQHGLRPISTAHKAQYASQEERATQHATCFMQCNVQRSTASDSSGPAHQRAHPHEKNSAAEPHPTRVPSSSAVSSTKSTVLPSGMSGITSL
jgi:hypothetical protein